VKTWDETIECCLTDNKFQSRITHACDIGCADQEVILFNLQMELQPNCDFFSRISSMRAKILDRNTRVIVMLGIIFITSQLIIKQSALTCRHVNNRIRAFSDQVDTG
jgi:hypothetical protein